MSEREMAITVGELIEALSKFGPSLPVGRTGYFGEFFAYEKMCVRELEATSEGWDWRKHGPKFSYIEIGRRPLVTSLTRRTHVLQRLRKFTHPARQVPRVRITRRRKMEPWQQ